MTPTIAIIAGNSGYRSRHHGNGMAYGACAARAVGNGQRGIVRAAGCIHMRRAYRGGCIAIAEIPAVRGESAGAGGCVGKCDSGSRTLVIRRKAEYRGRQRAYDHLHGSGVTAVERGIMRHQHVIIGSYRRNGGCGRRCQSESVGKAYPVQVPGIQCAGCTGTAATGAGGGGAAAGSGCTGAAGAADANVGAAGA